MHWPLENDAVAPSPPTVFVQAPTEAELAEVDPDGEARYAAAVAPLLELYRGGALRLGLAYRDTVPAGKTLRIRPAYSSWLGLASRGRERDDGPGDDGADPTAPGPWAADGRGPGRRGHGVADDGRARALGRRRRRRALALRRRVDEGARRASRRSTASPRTGPTSCSAPTGGLMRVGRFPDGDFAAVAEPTPDGRIVYALLHGADGTWWAGTSAGLGNVDARGQVQDDRSFKLEVATLAEDSTGAISIGGALRARRLPARRRRVVVVLRRGARATRTRSGASSIPDAQPAGDAQVFLPAVTAVPADGDGALWIGTGAGPRPLRRARRRRPGRLPHAARGVPRPLPGRRLRPRRGRARLPLGLHRPRPAALRRPRLLPVPRSRRSVGAARPRRLALPARRRAGRARRVALPPRRATRGSGSTRRSALPDWVRSPAIRGRARSRR